MSLQLVERTVPAFLVAPAGVLVVQPRMREGQLGAFGDNAKIDLDQRFAGILTAFPAPAHGQPFWSHNLEIFAAALMLAAVEGAETDPVTPTDAQIGLGHQHRAGVRPPPAGDA